jgi:hypothetical protein
VKDLALRNTPSSTYLLQRLLLEGAHAASTSGKRATLTDMASGIEEILERESVALAAQSRKGKRS